MIHALREARVTAPAPLDSLKKAEAAQMVAKAMEGCCWLPVSLREPSQQEVAGRQLAQAA